jgi:hypothetical protein
MTQLNSHIKAVEAIDTLLEATIREQKPKPPELDDLIAMKEHAEALRSYLKSVQKRLAGA